MAEVSGNWPEEFVVHNLTLRLEEAQQTLCAIRGGEVDALIVAANGQRQVFILRGADHAHRVLFETLSEGALTIAADTTILYANRRFAEMIGHPLEKVLGASLRGFIAPGDAEGFSALVARAADGRSRGEITLSTAGGAMIPVMASMSVIDGDEESSYTVVVTDLTPLKEADRALREANDALEARVEARTAELSRANEALRAEIAERTRLEEALRRKAAELTEADQRKDEFLSMLAHELRNPLAPIFTATEMMRAGTADRPPLERYRSVIERQVRNLARLVDDLLDVSRITRRTITLRKQLVELGPIVQSAVEAARPLIDGHHHFLRVALPVRPVRLWADPTRFEQVLVNVLNNAAKYTQRGGQIELSVELRGDEAVIRIRDNGVGIPADLLPQVFDLFIQGDRSLDRAQGGLGIGLTLVKSLVEMHGGTVEAHSDGPDHGSTFILRVPVAPSADASSSAPDAAAPKQDEPAEPSPSTRRVLIVEDNPDAAQTLVEMLSLWGHEVRHACSGADALELATTFQPEVALIDIGLPGMDGYEVARHLRRSGLVLIGLTGYGQPRDRSRAFEAGFDHHIVKPLDPERLRRILRGGEEHRPPG